jgi:CBS domain-containing protein
MDLLAKDMMTKAVVTVRPDMSLAELERRFIDDQVAGYPVIEDGKLAGVVSRSDVVRHLVLEHTIADVASGYYSDQDVATIPKPASEWVPPASGRDIDDATVRDVMKRDLITVEPDDPLLDVARLMTKRHIHRIPVTDAGRLVGVITSSDFVRFYAEKRIGLIVDSLN